MTDASPFLLTGASGFLGRHILETHAAEGRGAPLRALVRDPHAFHRQDWTAQLGGIELVQGSVTESKHWTAALPRLGAIVHLAALVQHSRRDTEPVFETNVEGTLAMVRLAAEHGCRLVVLSTSGTVGCFQDPDARADEHAPYCEEEVARWPYYRSKILLEKRARALADELGVELVIVRPPILLGPGDHRFRSTSTVLRVLRGKLPFLIRGGMHFADVRDAAQAVLRAAFLPTVRPVYHLEGTICSIEDFFGMLAEVSGAPAPRWLLPFQPAWLLATSVERLGIALSGQPWHLLPDPVLIEMASRHWGTRSRYAGELGYKCRDPRETLRDTAEWLRLNHEAFAS